MTWRTRFAMAAVGAGTMLFLHLCFLVLWKAVFVRFPQRGYEKAMSEGRVEAFFTNSSLSLFVTWGVLFASSRMLKKSAFHLSLAGSAYQRVKV